MARLVAGHDGVASSRLKKMTCYRPGAQVMVDEVKQGGQLRLGKERKKVVELETLLCHDAGLQQVIEDAKSFSKAIRRRKGQDCS